MTTLNLIPLRATVLVALPGALQSVFAGLGDFYTWKLAMDIYGRESNAPWAAVSSCPHVSPSAQKTKTRLSCG
jgi:phosphatidylinositol glycan class B